MKLLLVFFIALFMGLFSHAQFSDLGTLSDGDLIHFQPILDNDEKLFGYLVIYDLGMTGDETRKFEYIFLDKNLNEVSSKEYEGNKLVQYYYGHIADNNEFLIIPKYSLNKRKDRKLSVPETLILDMKNNTLKTKIYTCYTENGFEDCETYDKSFEEREKDIEKERKENGFVYNSQVRELKNGGFLVYDYKDMGKNELKSYTAESRFQRFDADKNRLWEFHFNKNADKKNNESYYLLEWDDSFAFFLKQIQKKNDLEFYLVAMDVEEGKILNELDLDQVYGKFSPMQFFYFDKIDVDYTFQNEDVFKILAMNYSTNFSHQEGYVTHTYDKKTNEFTEDWLYYADLYSFIDINSIGKIDKKYLLYERDVYFLKEGSVGILTEKGMSKKNGKIITTDMVMINTNADFEPTEVVTLEKDKTKSFFMNDYLFSQYLNEDKDVVFFYKDYQKDDQTKDQNWILYINTIIDGKFQQEEIPISSEEHFIYPFIAKEGYILFREFNKNEKYDQIRLERLNF